MGSAISVLVRDTIWQISGLADRVVLLAGKAAVEPGAWRCSKKAYGEIVAAMTPSVSEPVWEFQHSTECNAPRQFAWRFWTDIANWNDPPAKFDLDGPFEIGARLTTTLPDQTWYSIIRDLKQESGATIEMQLPDAILSFHWSFEELSENKTLITQRLVLSGPGAKSLVSQVNTMEVSAPEGMKKVVAAIERAQRRAGKGREQGC